MTADRRRQSLDWSTVRDDLHSHGMRGTPQRRVILDVLATATGHVSTGQIIDQCLERDPEMTPSTVYRTLDVLERLGYLRHSHAADGHEEFHVLPGYEHAHLQCERCHGTWELSAKEARQMTEAIRRSRNFQVHLGHLTITGLCPDCSAEEAGRRSLADA